MRIKEGGILCRDDDVALPEEVEPTAAGHAVHCGNDGLPQPLTLRTDLLTGLVVRGGIEPLLSRHIAPINTGAKRSVSCTGQYDTPYRIVQANMAPEGSEFVLHT